MWLSHMVSEPWQAALVNVTKVPLTEMWMLEFVILGLITAGHSDLTTFTKQHGELAELQKDDDLRK